MSLRDRFEDLLRARDQPVNLDDAANVEPSSTCEVLSAIGDTSSPKASTATDESLVSPPLLVEPKKALIWTFFTFRMRVLVGGVFMLIVAYFLYYYMRGNSGTDDASDHDAIDSLPDPPDEFSDDPPNNNLDDVDDMARNEALSKKDTEDTPLLTRKPRINAAPDDPLFQPLSLSRHERRTE